jgi:predicted ATPase
VNNLPAQITPLIGRDNELKAAAELLLRDDVRLVTFVGSGGSGKTRLSVEAARALVEMFSGGVFFVSLAGLKDPSLVTSQITSTLGAPERKDVRLLQSLKDYLEIKRILLVLDNFEQVISAAEIVAELLEGCPLLKILATSRSPLRVSGEHEFPVLPLPIPKLKGPASVNSLLEIPSVALFVQRAQKVRPGFSLSEENAEAVREICVSLDGLPLALELAAAQIRVLSPEQMLKLLPERGLDFLTQGPRDLPARQQTLRGAFTWSYDLLDEDERKLLRRSSAFASSFSLVAAEAVCSAVGSLRGKALDGLFRLVEKSLLQRIEVDGQIRFGMLNTIRDFASELFQGSDESHRTLEAYVDFFLSLAEDAETKLRGPEEPLWLKRLDLEYDNLREALRWSIENNQTDRGLRLVCALWSFWHIQGYFAEGQSWLKKVLAKTGSIRNPFRAKALMAAGVLAAWEYDFQTARSLLTESEALSQELRDDKVTASALYYLASITEAEGDYQEANRLLEKSLALSRKVGNKRGVALAFNGLGIVARDQGVYDKAGAFHEQSLKLFKEVGDMRYIAHSLANLASTYEGRRDYDAAGNLFGESLALLRKLGDSGAIAELTLDLAISSRRRGNFKDAEARLVESLSLSKELGRLYEVTICLDELGICAYIQGEAKRAARLWGAAESFREARMFQVQPARRAEVLRNIADAKSSLGEETFRQDWVQGSTTPLDEIIAYALKLNSAN